MKIKNNFLVVCALVIASCSDLNKSTNLEVSLHDKPLLEVQTQPRPLPNPDKNAYFGDLHVHTENSFDAYTFGTISTPADAYKYAQGHAIQHPSGYLIQLSKPLDFYAVTDHGIFMGLMKEAADTTSEFSKYEFTKPLHNLNDSGGTGFFSLIKRNGLFRLFGENVREGLADGSIDGSLILEVGRTVWQKTIKAADDAYVPGSFTSFAA